MKKLLNIIISIVLLAPMMLIFTACENEGIVLTVGQNGNYQTLSEAVNAVEANNELYTIKLLENLNGSGFVVKENQNIVFNFNGNTYLMDGATVGSAGTETNGFQLLKGSNVVFKNGTMKQSGAKILIQNYSNLTIDNFTIDARSNSQTICSYALSNNFGNIMIKNQSNIYAYNGQVAFDLWYGMSSSYDQGVNVKFDNSFSGTVQGKIEYGAANRATTGWESKTKLEIENGTFNIGAIDLTKYTENANISIKGGSFDIDVTGCVANGYKCTLKNNRYIVEKA